MSEMIHTEHKTNREEIVKLTEFNLDVIRLMLGQQSIALSDKAKEKIVLHDWSHSVQKLETILEQAARRCQSGIIEPDDIEIQDVEKKDPTDLPMGLKLEELERKYILQTLYIAGQNRTKAAEMLGISIRTLRNKISQYRLEGFL